MVPWLLIAATALFAAGPWLKPKPSPTSGRTAAARPAGWIVQFVTAVYGGFFGAGMGVMMLATLGLTQGGDYHRLNALKNMLAIVIAAVAIVVFVVGRRGRLAAGAGHGARRGARRLCRRLARQARAAERRARLRHRGRAVSGGLLFRDRAERLSASRSGRRSAVSFSASARRHVAILPWLPEVSTSGIGRPFEFLRPRVVRMLEQAVLETLLVARSRVAHDARQQPHHRVEQHQRRRLAAGQDEVADRKPPPGRAHR